IDVRHIEDAEAARTHRGVKVFATQLHIEHIVATVLICRADLASTGDKFLVVVRVRKLLEVAACDNRRLRARSNGNGRKPSTAVGHIDVLAHEVEEVRSLYQQLRHPCIVVAGSGYVAVGASLGFPSAYSVRNIGAERFAAEAGRGNGLLLVINPVAVAVLRTHNDGAG